MESFPKPQINIKKETGEIDKEDKKNEMFDLFQDMYIEIDSISILPENRNNQGRLLSPNRKESKLQNEFYWKLVRTPSFLKWFGDWQNDPENSSKIVDKETREPLLVYHATTADIGLEGLQVADHSNSGDHIHGAWKQLVLYFTSEPQKASYFVESKDEDEDFFEEDEYPLDLSGGSNPKKQVSIFSNFLNIRNPVIVDDHDELSNLFRKEDMKLPSLKPTKKEYPNIESRNDMLESGYDGIYQKHGRLFFSPPGYTGQEIDGDQFVAFSPDQIITLPSDIGLKSTLEQEKRLDFIRIWSDYLSQMIPCLYAVVSSGWVKKASDSYVKDIKDKVEKTLPEVDILLSNPNYSLYFRELKKQKRKLENYRNHFNAIIAFLKKDKFTLSEAIRSSKWKTSQLEDLFSRLK